MATLDELKQILAWVYIIPTFALYIAMLYLIFISPKKSTFSGAFYKIYGVSIIYYIIYTLTYWIHYRMLTIVYLFPWLKTWPTVSWIYPVIMISNFYACYVVIGFALLISFNRVTVFVLRGQYNLFWKRHTTKFLLFFSFAPLIFIWNFPWLGISNTQQLTGYGAYIGPTAEWPVWWNRSRNLVIELCTVGFSTFFMDVYSVFSIVRYKYFHQNHHSSLKITSQDIAMVAYSICLFLTDCFCASGQLLLVIDRTTYQNYVLSTQYLSIDVLTLVPGWFVFVTNTPLRNEIFIQIFGWKKKTNVVSITGSGAGVLNHA